MFLAVSKFTFPSLPLCPTARAFSAASLPEREAASPVHSNRPGVVDRYPAERVRHRGLVEARCESRLPPRLAAALRATTVLPGCCVVVLRSPVLGHRVALCGRLRPV